MHAEKVTSSNATSSRGFVNGRFLRVIWALVFRNDREALFSELRFNVILIRVARIDVDVGTVTIGRMRMLPLTVSRVTLVNVFPELDPSVVSHVVLPDVTLENIEMLLRLLFRLDDANVTPVLKAGRSVAILFKSVLLELESKRYADSQDPPTAPHEALFPISVVLDALEITKPL